MDPNEIVVEISFYPNHFPQIRSYYVMDHTEYEELENIEIDLFIDNFFDNEDLTSDQLYIHVIQNENMCKLIKEFLYKFGNPFDILTYIKQLQHNKNNIEVQRTNTTKQSNENDGNNCIDTITEIIESYNKSGTIDHKKIETLKSISKNKIIDDEIINDLCNDKNEIK